MGLCILTFFHFPDSGVYLFNGFDFYLDLFWMAWHWKPAIWPPGRHVKTRYSIIRAEYGGNKYSQRFTFRSRVNRSCWFVFHLKIIIHHQRKNSFLKLFRKKEQEEFNSYSFQFIKKGKIWLQNSPYFCVFKYARAVKRKVWNEAENRERDWGETLKIRFFSLATLYRFLYWFWEKKPTVLQSRVKYYSVTTSTGAT